MSSCPPPSFSLTNVDYIFGGGGGDGGSGGGGGESVNLSM